MKKAEIIVNRLLEATDPDDPHDMLRSLPTQTYVVFERSLAEDQEFAETHFPGMPLEQALAEQLIIELAAVADFDMATVKIASPAKFVDEDTYAVRLLFIGYPSDVALRNRLQQACDEGMAGMFGIEHFSPYARDE